MDYENNDNITAAMEFEPLSEEETRGGFDIKAVKVEDFSAWGVPQLVRNEPAVADAIDERTKLEKDGDQEAYRLEVKDLGREKYAAKKMEALDDSSLEGVDMLTALEAPRAQATVFRTEKGGIFYAGMSNAIYGKGGEGKSLLAAVAAVETLLDGGRVLWIDYEQDAAVVGHRLLDIELNGQQIPRSVLGSNQFSYRRPELPLTGEKWEDMTGEKWDLVVIDSINQALGSHIPGGDSKEGSHVNQWDREVRQPLTRTGACVLTIDHIPKNADTPTPYGAQEKTATLSGSSVYVKPAQPSSRPAKGKEGKLELIVQKDRHGSIETDGSGTRGLTGTAALVVIDSSSDDGKIRVSIQSHEQFRKTPERMEADAADFVLKKYREYHEQGEKLTFRVLGDLSKGTAWSRRTLESARDRLVDEGRLTSKGKGTQACFEYNPQGDAKADFDPGEPML